MPELTLDAYLTMGDTYTYLYSEFIYLKNYINSIGEKPRYEQINSLIENLEKKESPKNQTVKVLISIFYLLLEHEEETYAGDEGFNFLKFKVMIPYAKSINSPILLSALLK